MKPEVTNWIWPTTLVGRTVLILFLGLTASHLISFLIYDSEKRSALGLTAHGQLADRIVTITSLIAKATPDEQVRVTKAANGAAFRVEIAVESEVAQAPDREPPLLREALSLRMLDAPVRLSVSSPETGILDTLKHLVVFGDADHPMREHFASVADYLNSGETIRASVQIATGRWVNFSAPSPEYYVSWTPRFALSILVMLGSVAVFSVWAVRQTISPLREFTTAAERLGRNLDEPPLAELGSIEVRRAAQAFNTMHTRIQRFVEDRTRMIAAISHDLRTPLTRLRFRSELIEDEEQREKIVRDVEEMENMILATLLFAREEAQSEPVSPLNLNATMHEICAGMTELGHTVAIQRTDNIIVSCRPLSLRRALTNIVENALRYGGRAQVAIDSANGFARVSVNDEGPGIPEDRLEDVFQPFHRLDHSRNKETGGVGLGLSVARNIVRSQGGDVVLRNRASGGLCAEVTLPL